jgi:hypothetical protein
MKPVAHGKLCWFILGHLYYVNLEQLYLKDILAFVVYLK